MMCRTGRDGSSQQLAGGRRRGTVEVFLSPVDLRCCDLIFLDVAALIWDVPSGAFQLLQIEMRHFAGSASFHVSSTVLTCFCWIRFVSCFTYCFDMSQREF
jgi:hypothetical protein